MGFEDNIRKIDPYIPGEQPKKKVIKLNTNECPYPPSPEVIRALREADWERLRLYPEPACDTLVDALADHYGLRREQVFAGVGSDDVLSMCFLTFFAGDRPILFPEITYSFYDVWAKVYGIPFETIELNEDLTLDPSGFKKPNGGVVIANPNAPTGVAESREVIEGIIEYNKDSVVIVDEAYIDFGGESVLPLIDRYPNLIVTRTMSKSRALAGMRIGYCFGDERLIKYLNDVKYSVNSYTMNMPALIAGAAAIRDTEYFRQTIEKIKKTREWTKERLREMGFTFNDSRTNFIFAKVPKGCNAKEIFEGLRSMGIYVRYFDKPKINDRMRISVGTDDEMNFLIGALKKLTRT